MKGKDILSAIYDKALYTYSYVDIIINQTIDRFVDYRANVKWVRKNGPYNGNH